MSKRKSSKGTNGRRTKDDKFNVLYVDDEPVNLRIFQASFRRTFNIFTAENGLEGLDLLREENIHVIVSDQRMPGLSGTEFLEKTLQEYPDLIRIILTGFADIEVIVQAVNKCNIYRYMTKPYDRNDMKLTLEQAVESLMIKRERDELVQKLSRVNKNLEKKVKERTRELEKVNEKLTEGLLYAQTVQELMLPKQDKLKVAFKDAFIIYHPKDYVGGDFFWFQNLKEKRSELAILAVFDCMGHGVAGALLSMIGETKLSQIINENGFRRADKIMTELDQSLLKTLAQSRPEVHENTMDASMIVFDKKKGQLEFCGAKQDLFYVKEGKLNRLKGTRKSIGSPWHKKVKFESNTIPVKGITEIYLFSDGIQDQVNGDYSRKFGIRQLQKLLSDHHAKDFKRQQNLITKAVKEWKKDAEQIDDMTLMGIRF